MSQGRDPDLRGMFDDEPELDRISRVLQQTRFKSPPLDPGFRHALRRELMKQAYEQYERSNRPSFFASLFAGPRLAVAGGLAAVVLVGLVLVNNNSGNLLGPGQVEVTSPRAVAVDQPITVSFNQPMNHQSVEQSISIEPATQVTYQWQGNNLVIQPVAGQLAPNTQYHVTVNSTAKTANAAPIGKPATLAVTTAPLPTPAASPSPSPTPTPQPEITGESSLGVAGQVTGFSADAGRVFYLSPTDVLASVAVDGTDPKTVASAVKNASIAPGDAALAYVTEKGQAYLAGPDGSNPQLLGPAVAIAGWVGEKPYLIFGTSAGQEGGTPLKLPVADAIAGLLAPDGSKLIVVRPQGENALLVDVASGTSNQLDGQGFAWSHDSKRLAYWREGSAYVAAADGSGEKAVFPVAGPVGAAWTADGQRVLFAGDPGAWIVGADGAGLHQLGGTAVDLPLLAAGDTVLAFGRAGSIWLDHLTLAGAPTIGLGPAGSVVDRYEAARVKGDADTAKGLLSASPSPMPSPSPASADLKLTRYFVVSSQADATQATFTVRLIYSHGADEVRYQDETLTLAPAGADLRIAGVSDSPLRVLGKGPTVNAVMPTSTGLVVVFDSDIDPASLVGGYTVTAQGAPVQLTESYGHRKLTLTFETTPGTKYHLALAPTVKDIAGQGLQGGFDYDFVAGTTSS